MGWISSVYPCKCHRCLAHLFWMWLPEKSRIGEPSSWENWSSVNFRDSRHYYYNILSSLHTYKVRKFNSIWWRSSLPPFNIFDTKIDWATIKGQFTSFPCNAVQDNPWNTDLILPELLSSSVIFSFIPNWLLAFFCTPRALLYPTQHALCLCMFPGFLGKLLQPSLRARGSGSLFT